MIYARCFLGFLVLLTTCLSNASDSVVRFATEASYPPFELFDENQQLQGFDIELARSLCEVMHRRCVFSHQPFDSLIASLQFGRFDAIISALDITSERKRRVAFSQPYFSNSAVFIAQKGVYKKQRQLQKKVIAVQNGSSHQHYLLRSFVVKGTTTVPYASYETALHDLERGRCDAVFMDRAAAQVWLQQHSGYAMVGKAIIDPEFFGTGFGVAVKKDNNELLLAINQALDTLKKNGEYQRIYQRYFPGEMLD